MVQFQKGYRCFTPVITLRAAVPRICFLEHISSITGIRLGNCGRHTNSQTIRFEKYADGTFQEKIVSISETRKPSLKSSA
jgi:hypothetical protein